MEKIQCLLFWLSFQRPGNKHNFPVGFFEAPQLISGHSEAQIYLPICGLKQRCDSVDWFFLGRFFPRQKLEDDHEIGGFPEAMYGKGYGGGWGGKGGETMRNVKRQSWRYHRRWCPRRRLLHMPKKLAVSQWRFWCFIISICKAWLAYMYAGWNGKGFPSYGFYPGFAPWDGGKAQESKIIFRTRSYTPRKLNMRTWEYTPGKGKSFSKASFSGSMLIFGGCTKTPWPRKNVTRRQSEFFARVWWCLAECHQCSLSWFSWFSNGPKT